MVNNIFIVTPGLMVFALFATNVGEFPLHRPALKPVVIVGLLCLLTYFVWQI